MPSWYHHFWQFVTRASSTAARDWGRRRRRVRATVEALEERLEPTSFTPNFIIEDHVYGPGDTIARVEGSIDNRLCVPPGATVPGTMFISGGGQLAVDVTRGGKGHDPGIFRITLTTQQTAFTAPGRVDFTVQIPNCPNPLPGHLKVLHLHPHKHPHPPQPQPQPQPQPPPGAFGFAGFGGGGGSFG